MAKTKNTQDPTMEIGPATEGETQDALILTVPTVDMILPPDKEAAIIADMAALVKKYTGFEIKTKQDYERLKIDLRTVVSKRTMVDGKDGWRLSVKRLADKIGEKILAHLAPAEALLSGIKKAYDDAEAIRLAAIRAAAEKLLADRKSEIFALGGTYNGSAYVLGTIQIYPEELSTDDFIIKIESMRLEKVRLDEEEAERLAEVERQRLAKVEADRLAKEEADRVAAEAQRLADENAALLAQLAALKASKGPVVETPPVEVAAPVEAPTLFEDAPKVANPAEFPREGITSAHIVVPPTVQEPPKVVETVAKPAQVVTPPTVTLPAKFQPSDRPMAEADLHIYKSGAYALAKMARKKFPQIGALEWKALWDEFSI